MPYSGPRGFSLPHEITAREPRSGEQAVKNQEKPLGPTEGVPMPGFYRSLSFMLPCYCVT